MVGITCTQYNLHFLACPRAISTQLEPAISTGIDAIAWRTVSALGPSESLQVSARDAAGVGGFPPQAAANKTRKITK
ncbi:hypothetical protein NJB14197_50080 [Mycobacterium montefiorense]|uniref:Uncharacterized protein n=1 Tax=Mycobacterium montefiorense TaxID=154654 RepID=A0ABQ0NTG5_9MYCO|nr:hypothetical protein MmonteBS_44850 [Mycobacterium montefiorense]GKU38038.1 hypothetical protein NJB14192_00370 [Mycobacterium montefiorense]GKU47300.1 hypothetical protein NJB14194_39180 [Mycobacterium montefiorense]GKU50447.1 hypothetical protein NJB14195_16930 [Mycobacterium montefiorense]GKU59148.1 hypothetical protein NJB14197_50080 [Mycobacterium montefiorense]